MTVGQDHLADVGETARLPVALADLVERGGQVAIGGFLTGSAVHQNRLASSADEEGMAKEPGEYLQR